MIIFLVLYACSIKIFTVVAPVVALITLSVIFGKYPQKKYMEAYAYNYPRKGSHPRPILVVDDAPGIENYMLDDYGKLEALQLYAPEKFRRLCQEVGAYENSKK